MNIKVLSINLVIMHMGAEKATFEIDLPYQFPSFGDEVSKSQMDMSFPRGHGLKYLKEHFPDIEVRVIEG